MVDIITKNDDTILKKNIRNKINGYNIYDKKLINKYPDENINLKTINSKELYNFIKEKNIKNCPFCNDEILYHNYKPYCYYQFSIDRINNKEIHHINNIQIVCYYCNWMKNNDDINNYNRYKIWGYCCKIIECKNKCHLVDDNKNLEIKKNCPKELIKSGCRHPNLIIEIN